MSHHVPRDPDGDDAHEGRRNLLLALGLGAVAVVVVGIMFAVIGRMTGPTMTASAAPKLAATTTTTAPAAASTTTDDKSMTAPPIAVFTPSTTVSLPPPEQPTLTAPVAGQTADPDPNAPATTQAAPPAQSPPPAQTSVSNVNLACAKGDKAQVTATLTFSTTGQVQAVVTAAGKAQSQQAGPGNVTMTAQGRGAGVCLARIGNQVVGPVQAG